jgi:hypothetical protein
LQIVRPASAWIRPLRCVMRMQPWRLKSSRERSAPAADPPTMPSVSVCRLTSLLRPKRKRLQAFSFSVLQRNVESTLYPAPMPLGSVVERAASGM